MQADGVECSLDLPEQGLVKRRVSGDVAIIGTSCRGTRQVRPSQALPLVNSPRDRRCARFGLSRQTSVCEPFRNLGRVPRRSKPDPLALAVGARVRQLREEADLTIERLAFELEVGSKGHLSSLEKGLVRPTIQTLKAIADGLGVAILDLVTFPEEDERQRLVDATRYLRTGQIRVLMQEAESARRLVTKTADASPGHYRPRTR
jgi:transcriptional regulator with XRE-family HTH domain